MKYIIILLAACVLVPPAHAQTFMANNCITSSGASAVSAAACTITVGAHHAIAGFARLNGTTTFIGLSDTLGNSFSTSSTVTGVGATHELFWSCDTGAGGSDTITVTANAAGQRFEMDILEYVGVATSSCNDGTQNSLVTGTTPGTPVASLMVTTTNASDLLVGFAGMNVGGTWTASTGYTIRVVDTIGEDMVMEDNLVSSTGTYATNPTFSMNGNWVAGLMTLKRATIASCNPTISDPYFVQGVSGIVNSSSTLAILIPCHSATGNKIEVAFSMIQSTGNHAETATVVDTDSNSYTQRECIDGGSGNQTLCAFEATASTNNRLVVTISYTPVNDTKVIKGYVSEYQHTSAFSAFTVCAASAGTTCSTTTPFSTSLNTFYIAMAAEQGNNGVVFTGPSGYVQRTFVASDGNGVTSSTDGLGVYDKFLAPAQGPNYSVTFTSNMSPGGIFTGILLTYGVTSVQVPHRAVIY